ncbi:MAG TPA: hypothetical protein VHA78_05785 [Candidatus Peribacteraceae bacterium]|nr:hypothetical protein [Candidatus Peribacteraceae bacterium]
MKNTLIFCMLVLAATQVQAAGPQFLSVPGGGIGPPMPESAERDLRSRPQSSRSSRPKRQAPPRMSSDAYDTDDEPITLTGPEKRKLFGHLRKMESALDVLIDRADNIESLMDQGDQRLDKLEKRQDDTDVIIAKILSSQGVTRQELNTLALKLEEAAKQLAVTEQEKAQLYTLANQLRQENQQALAYAQMADAATQPRTLIGRLLGRVFPRAFGYQ